MCERAHAFVNSGHIVQATETPFHCLRGSAMSDPIWIDANVLAHIANGDVSLEAVLIKLRKDGRQLLMPPAANNEYLNGNPLTMKPSKPVSEQAPSAETRVKLEQVKVRLGVSVDMEAEKLGMAKRVGYAMQDHVKRPRNQATPPSLDRISESDSLVLSQVKAGAEARGVANPELITAEQKGVLREGSVYGVKVYFRKGPPSPGSGGSGGGNLPTAIVKSGGGGSSMKMMVAQSFKVIGLGLVQAALAFAAAYLWKKAAESFFQVRMTELQPKIDAQIRDHSAKIASLLSQGKKAYANITIRVRSQTDYVNETGQSIEGFPFPILMGAFVSDENINLKQGTERTRGFGSTVTEEQFTYSVEVSIGSEAINLFRQLMDQYNAQKTRLRSSPSDPAAEKKLEEIKASIIEAFGAGASYDVLDADLWPKFKYKGTPTGG